MKRIKVMLTIFAGVITSIALTLGVASTQAVCMIHFHQPKVPQGMSKFIKS